MEIILGSCVRAKIRYIITFIFGFFILGFSSKVEVQLITSFILIVVIISEFIFDKNPIELRIDESETEIVFCKYFGFSKKRMIVSNQSIYFKYMNEPYVHGMRNVLRVYEKQTNKLLFNIASDINGRKNLEAVLEVIRKANIQEVEK